MIKRAMDKIHPHPLLPPTKAIKCEYNELLKKLQKEGEKNDNA